MTGWRATGGAHHLADEPLMIKRLFAKAMQEAMLAAVPARPPDPASAHSGPVDDFAAATRRVVEHFPGWSACGRKPPVHRATHIVTENRRGAP
jgi:hypothetical protein